MKKLNDHERINLLETAFDSSYDGIHILDSNGDSVFINEACTRIEGTSKDEVMSKNIKDLVKEGVYNESVTLKVLETKQPQTIVQKTVNGKEILVTGTPMYKDGKIAFVIVNSRDVTDLSRFKKELLDKNKQTEKYKTEIEHLRKANLKIPEIASRSPIMKKVLRLSANIAKTDSTVMITGESGTGKSVLSRLIHSLSNRADGPFIKIDCGSIPENLFESELFGYERGAFTGANREGKTGLMELANGGTLFFDEIGDMPLHMQVKILSALQERKIIPVGGQKERDLDVRVISATNVDLRELIEKKKFREDLYYRLNVVPIEMPPLRETPEDITDIIKQTESNINQKYSWHKRLSVEVINLFVRYRWPGNIRELENVVERLLVSVNGDEVNISDVPNYIRTDTGQTDPLNDFKDRGYKEALANYDNTIIKAVIDKTGSIPEAAKKLGIDVTTLRRKLKKYNMK